MRALLSRRVRARWTWWVAFLSALVLIAQIPAQAVGSVDEPTTTTTTSQSQTPPDASPAEACAAQAPTDPPLWERSLPITQVSSQMSASDPGCVTNVVRTADSVRWQNPDGTMTANTYSTPMNYQGPDGSWQPIDTRLKSIADGAWENRAGPVDAQFAASAASQSLVDISSGGSSLSYSLDGEQTSDNGLVGPAASTGVVSGDGSNVLTYASVWPSIDVKYQMVTEGVKEAIVLNSPLAANQQPSFEFAVALNGLTARTADDGTIEFVDAAGVTIYSIPSGLATDAAEDSTPVKVTLVASDDPSTATIVVSIPQNWLADPAREFPVTIDPTSTVDVADDTFVGDGSNATTNFYGFYNTTFSEWANNAGTTSSKTYNTLQKFNFAPLAGAYIVSAQWHGYSVGLAGTTPIALTLKPISSSWWPTTVNWNTQPSERTNTATSGGYTAAGQWKTADITSWVQNYADGTWTNYGVEIHGSAAHRVTLGSDFSSHPGYVQVTYDAYPQASHASDGGILTSSIVRTSTPTLSAEIDDSDTSSGLTGDFVIYDATKTSVVQTGIGSTTNSGGRSSWTVPTALSDGTYYYLVYPNDALTATPTTTFFPLTVDTAGPNTPTVSLAIGGSAVTANSWTTAGGPVTVNLGGNGSTNVHGFYWGLDANGSPSTFALASSNSASFSITPPWGWHDLAVRSIDTAGNLSGSVAHLTFGWGTGGLASPTEDSQTQGLVSVQANAPTSVDGVTLQWRRSDADTWQTVPAADVTNAGTPIGSWPATTTPGSYQSAFPMLVWNAASTTSDVNGNNDGPIQLQAGFSTGGGSPTYSTDDASIVDLTLIQNAGGSASISEPIGPGQVDLLSGNFELSTQDASTPAGDVSRTFDSLDPGVSGGVLGTGWSSDLDGSSSTLQNNGVDVVITTPDGSRSAFATNADGSYTSPAGSTGTLTYDSGVNQFKLADPQGGSTTYSNEDSSQPTLYLPTADEGDGVTTVAAMKWQVASPGVTRALSMSAPVPGVTCTSSPLTTQGCQTLTFSYATTTTATGTSSGQWGDYAGQLQTVHYTAWDPDLGTPAMHTVDVATYLYDNNGMLRAAWDPRISPALKTTYSYDSYGHVSTLTPPGVNGWTFNYAPLAGEPASTGRLGSVSRAAIPSGTATTTVVYKVPLTTTSSPAGPYNMSESDVSAWAQQDFPTDATAIFPPDQTPSAPPSSYTRATVYYLDSQGQLVNVAAPGGNITTTEYDQYGNDIRDLAAGDRQEALASSTNTAQEAALARILDSETVYDADGALVTDTLGPAHVVDLSATSAGPARRHVHNVYDENVPTSPVDLTPKEPFDLLTTSTESAVPLENPIDEDPRTTSYVYAIGSDESGWTLGTPLQTIVDPGTGTHLHLTTTTLYDGNGNLTARILPANPSGGDAHETDFIDYSATGTGTCNGTPEYAGMPCTQGPAAQPTSGSPMPSTRTTKYNMYSEAEISIDTSGAVTRTTTIGYDAAGRPISKTITTAGTGTGTTTPTVTTSYDTATGLPYQTSTSSPAQTITRAYDALGRMTSYTDADGNTSTYTYDLLDRPSTTYDGKGTTTYTYDDVGSEERGLPTTISDSAIGNFTAAYNADGQLITQTAPGGLAATYSYDEAGEPTGLAYAKGTGSWPGSYRRYNIHGEATSMSSGISNYAYSYDAAARLIDSYDQNIFGCLDRNYTFDADANRTNLVEKIGITWASSPTNCPPSGSGTPTTYSYDEADRLATSSGYAYDNLGRTTSMPAATSPSGYATALGYYTNDLVNTVTANGITTAYNIDPNQRDDSYSVSGQAHTSHFADDGDSPAWTSENTAGSTWNRYISGFNGMAATINQGGSVTLDLVNLHGDIIAPAATSDTTWNLSATQTETSEYGVTSAGSPARYDYLGTKQRQRDGNSGLQLMGARVYNPTNGRFLQTDPVLGGSANGYDYAGGDPVNRTDLTGTRFCGGDLEIYGHVTFGTFTINWCASIGSTTVYIPLDLTKVLYKSYLVLHRHYHATWLFICGAQLKDKNGKKIGQPLDQILGFDYSPYDCADDWDHVGGNFSQSGHNAMVNNACLTLKFSSNEDIDLLHKNLAHAVDSYRGKWSWSKGGLGEDGGCDAK